MKPPDWSSSPTPVNSFEWNIILFVYWGMMLHLVRSICERWNLIQFDLSIFPCSFQVNGKSSSLLEAQEIPLDMCRRDCYWDSVVTYLCEKSASWIFVFVFCHVLLVMSFKSWDFKFYGSFVHSIVCKTAYSEFYVSLSIFLNLKTCLKSSPIWSK